MTFDEFRSSLASDAPPTGLGGALTSLWWDGRDDWEQAHNAVAHDETDPDAAWVHAYLHRKEGDAGNARYWYRRVGRPACSGPAGDEWSALVTALLDRSGARS